MSIIHTERQIESSAIESVIFMDDSVIVEPNKSKVAYRYNIPGQMELDNFNSASSKGSWFTGLKKRVDGFERVDMSDYRKMFGQVTSSVASSSTHTNNRKISFSDFFTKSKDAVMSGGVVY